MLKAMQLKQTRAFSEWLGHLRDKRARERIETRLERVKDGNFGTLRNVGEGVSELKIDYGPGYRVYFTRRGELVVLLLCGGNKSTQTKISSEQRSLLGSGRIRKMALETTVWKITDHLQEDQEAIFYYLEAELEYAEPRYSARALANVIEVRGGVDKLAQESGVSVDELSRAAADLETVPFDTMTKVMEAFRPASEADGTKVA